MFRCVFARTQCAIDVERECANGDLAMSPFGHALCAQSAETEAVTMGREAIARIRGVARAIARMAIARRRDAGFGDRYARGMCG